MEAQIGGPLILKKIIKILDEYKTNEVVLVDQEQKCIKRLQIFCMLIST